MSRIRALTANLLVAAVALVVVGVAVEVALRLFYPRSERHFVLPPDQTVTMTPDRRHVTGVTGSSVHRTSSQGIRGREFEESDDYRILAIGGSTTQNVYLDQDETWTLLLEELLGREHPDVQVWAGDVGRSGHTARSHVLQFEHLLPELPRIDAVVILAGVNDLTRALERGFDYEPDPPLSDPEARSAQMRQAFMRVPGRLHDRATLYQEDWINPVKKLAVYQLARLAKQAAVRAGGGTRQDRFGEAYARWRSNRASATAIHDSLPDLDEALRQYRGYLETIAASAAERGVHLVFLTQPVLWRDDLTDGEASLLWLGGTGNFMEEEGHAYFSPGALREGMDAFNATMLEVCGAYPADCVDLASLLPSDTSNFYDDVHFTERGSELVARHLARYFSTLPPFDAGLDSGSAPVRAR